MIMEIILLVFAIPTGLLIAWMAKDELKQGRKWFKLLVVSSLAVGLLSWIYNLAYIALTCAFIAIVSSISLLKGKN